MGCSIPNAYAERRSMDNNHYNEERHNRKMQWYRFTLGIQQLITYPLWNLIWIVFALGVAFFIIAERKLFSSFSVYPLFAPIFNGCMYFLMIFIPVTCAIGIVQFIGKITAINEEADLSIVFGDNHVKNQTPILIYKKKDKKSGVIARQFYTTIPMERWQEKKEAIADRLDIHFVGDITYGGKKKNRGNYIYFESAKGRKTTERGVLYDDTF